MGDRDDFHAVSIGLPHPSSAPGGRRQSNPSRRGVQLDRSGSLTQASQWERPADEPLKSYLSRVKTKIVRSAMLQGSCGITMLITSIISADYLGWSDSYTNFATGGRLIDLQYVYSILTLVLGMTGVYLWTRFWWQVQKDEDRLLRMLKAFIIGFISSWGLGIWTLATVFVQFPDLPSYIQDEATDFHTYILTDIIVLGFYLLVGLHYISSLFVNTHQLVDKKYIEGTILTVPQSSAFNRAGTVDFRKSLARGGGDDDDSSVSGAGRTGGGGGGGSHRVGSRRFETPSAPPMAGTGHGGALGIDSGGGFAYPSLFLDPRQFEALWEAQAVAGEFKTKVENVPAREDIVNHLSEKGFQVVAAGASAGEFKILFCARKASNRATEVVWFLCEFNISLAESSLSCVMKCPDRSVLPVFVQSFALDQIMKPILSPVNYQR